MESPNTSLQAIELSPSCSEQAYPNRPGTGPGNKNTEPGCILTILHFLFVIFPFRSTDAKSGKVVQKIRRKLVQTGVWILISLGEHLRTNLEDHVRYDQGPEIHGKPRRVSLPVGEAQLAGCLKVWISGPLEWDAGIQ